MNNDVINVAIDGPGGAGKSTSARAAAKELGYIYVDTGALYRSVGVNALRNNVDTKDFSAVAASLEGISVDLAFENGEQKVLLNGEVVDALSFIVFEESAYGRARKIAERLKENIKANPEIVILKMNSKNQILNIDTAGSYVPGDDGENIANKQSIMLCLFLSLYYTSL